MDDRVFPVDKITWRTSVELGGRRLVYGVDETRDKRMVSVASVDFDAKTVVAFDRFPVNYNIRYPAFDLMSSSLRVSVQSTSVVRLYLLNTYRVFGKYSFNPPCVIPIYSVHPKLSVVHAMIHDLASYIESGNTLPDDDNLALQMESMVWKKTLRDDNYVLHMKRPVLENDCIYAVALALWGCKQFELRH